MRAHLAQALLLVLPAWTAAHAADGAAPSTTSSAVRSVQAGGVMMWVLDVPAPAAAPATLPALDTQVVDGRLVRVLRQPGPAVAVASNAAAPHAALVERTMADGRRMLVLASDAPVTVPQRPALLERIIDPGQVGTRPGDPPAAATLYRPAAPR